MQEPKAGQQECPVQIHGNGLVPVRLRSATYRTRALLQSFLPETKNFPFMVQVLKGVMIFLHIQMLVCAVTSPQDSRVPVTAALRTSPGPTASTQAKWPTYLPCKSCSSGFCLRSFLCQLAGLCLLPICGPISVASIPYQDPFRGTLKVITGSQVSKKSCPALPHRQHLCHRHLPGQISMPTILHPCCPCTASSSSLAPVPLHGPTFTLLLPSVLYFLGLGPLERPGRKGHRFASIEGKRRLTTNLVNSVFFLIL